MMFFHGQELKCFRLCRVGAVISSQGRVLQNQMEEVGHISGVLAVAKSEEISRWRQLTHPVSHKVIVKGSLPDIRVGDVLKLGSRELIITMVPYDVGGLGHYNILYCTERSDV